MSVTYNQFLAVVLYSLSALFSIGITAVFFLRARRSPMLKAFLNVQYLVFIWLLTSTLRVTTMDPELVWLWVVVQYLAVCMFGIVFIDFAYLYRFGRFLPQGIRTAGYIISGFNYLMLFLNPLHNLFFAEFNGHGSVLGPAFYVHTFWSYILVGLAYVFLVSALFKEHYMLKRMQVLIFSSGLLLPSVISVITVFNLVPTAFDLTPISFNMTILVFGYSAYRYRFLDIKKVTRRMVIDNLHEGIIIIDADNRLLMINPVFQRYVDNYSALRKIQDVPTFFGGIANFIQNGDELYQMVRTCVNADQQRLTVEVVASVRGLMKTFLFKVERLEDGAGDRVGYVMRLIDISRYKELLTSVEEKNDAMRRINEQLSENITAARRLTIARERGRLSKEIHDILGHTMTVVIALLEMAKGTLVTDRSIAIINVRKSMYNIRTGLRELKDSLFSHRNERMDALALQEELKRLIREFEQSGVSVELISKGSEEVLSSQVYDAIYRICQEGLTNALRHGEAENVTIGLRFLERNIDLFIIDDGQGCGKVIKGNGLTGMENRVQELSGYFSCGSPEGDGFNIHVSLPYG